MSIPSRSDYLGLAIRGRNGALWRWKDYVIVTNRHGERVRVEELERECRFCSTPFRVRAKLPGGLRQRYLEARARGCGRPVELVLPEPVDSPIKAIHITNCERHRGRGAPLV